MKKILFMNKDIKFKVAIIALLGLLFPMFAYSDTVEVDGIEYILNDTEYSAAVYRSYYEDLIVPETIEYEGVNYKVTSVESGSFQNFNNLKNLVIPNSVTSIGAYCFSNCRNLETIVLSENLTHVGVNAFSGTKWYDNHDDGLVYLGCVLLRIKGETNNITSLSIKEGTKCIASGALENCYNMTSINLPESLIAIGGGAFTGCYSLLSISIPESVIAIGENAFMNCKNLTTINIPAGITSIESFTFRDCSSIIFIDIPNELQKIGEGAFWGCSSLVTLAIPNSVKEIGPFAFCYCGSLTSINIPNGITEIGTCTFEGCSSLLQLIIPEGVTKIGDEVFYRCTSLSNINIPESVTSIGPWAFSECTSLTNIKVSNQITDIEERSFYKCTALKSIELPLSLKTIGKDAFYGCTSLSSITIPANIEIIGEASFQNCRQISTVSFPESLKKIGDNAFSGCSNLSFTTIPNNTTDIGEQAFHSCNNLTNVSLPEGIKIIKKGTFKGCLNLDNLIIPASVLYIYQEAFAGCNNLEYVRALPENPPFMYDNSFSNFTVPLRVPKGCKEVYQTAQGWKNFTNISDADKYKLTYVVDNEVYKSYEIEEGTAISPEPAPMKWGYTFSGWSEIPQTMPAHDVTVTGTFNINKYKLTYTVDGTEYKSYEVEYGASITPEAEPTKEGYTFSGWSEIPETMPAHGVTVTGTFSINKYKLTYVVDGAEYKTYEIEYGAAITPEAVPTKEGYTFSGWSEIPSTMPPYDVTVTGSFNINSYKLTYMINDKVYKETMYEYGATIIAEPQPEGDYDTFEWIDLPQTMPAHDVVVYASYTSGIIEVLMASQHNVRFYSPNGKKLNKLQKGLNIVILCDGTIKKVIMK